jgi:hypothetical protein
MRKSRYVTCYDHGYSTAREPHAFKGDVYDVAHAFATQFGYVKGSLDYNAFYNGYVNGVADKVL